VNLRSFTKDDWAAYSGCSSDNPMIGFAGDLEAVIDDRWVTIFYTGADSWCEDYKFPDLSLAILFALGIQGSETHDQLSDTADLVGCSDAVQRCFGT
jgi:hypothetical protein